MTIEYFKNHIESYPDGYMFPYSISNAFIWKGNFTQVGFSLALKSSTKESILENINTYMNLGSDTNSFGLETFVNFEPNPNRVSEGLYTEQWLEYVKDINGIYSKEQELVNLLFS